MPMTTMSTKGQVVIPKEIRKILGWEPGVSIEIEAEGGMVVLRARKQGPELEIEDLLGCVPYEGPRRTLAEMEEAVARGAREQR